MYKPIEIDIDDKRQYAQIAFLVDSLTFLDLIEKVRSMLKIQSPFASEDYELWETHMLTLAGFDIKEYWKMDKISPKDKSWEKKSRWLKNTEKNFIDMASMQKSLMNSVVKIRKIHNYPTLFDSAIIDAILFNKIDSLKTAEATLAFGGMTPVHDKNDQILLISLSPVSSKKDVLDAFKDAKKLRKEYELTNPLDKKLDKDTLTNIRRVREWHWKQLQGMTYSEVVENWNKELDENSTDYIFDSNKVEQAVARYRRNLQTIMPKTDI